MRGAKGLGRHQLTFHTRLFDRFSLSDQGPGTPVLQKPFFMELSTPAHAVWRSETLFFPRRQDCLNYTLPYREKYSQCLFGLDLHSAADVLLKNADMFHPVNKQTRIGYKPLLKTKSKMIWQNWNVNISSFSFRGGIFSSNHYQMWYLVNKRPCPFACEWNESNEFEELTLEMEKH